MEVGCVWRTFFIPKCNFSVFLHRDVSQHRDGRWISTPSDQHFALQAFLLNTFVYVSTLDVSFFSHFPMTMGDTPTPLSHWDRYVQVPY